MTHQEAEVLVHAMLDGELDAGHARDLEAHLAGCPRCSAQLTAFRDLRHAIAEADLRLSAPAALRQRIDRQLPTAAPTGVQPVKRQTNRRRFLTGFAFGTALSAAAAATVVVGVFRSEQDRRIVDDVISAHLRSLHGEHLTDVLSSDQHTVKPWFNGRVDLAPPVVDLTAKGFTLLGGRLDYVEGKPAATIVYRRRTHVINLFVLPAAAAASQQWRMETAQGFNIYRWRANGLNVIAISDLNADELHEFCEKFEANMSTGSVG